MILNATPPKTTTKEPAGCFRCGRGMYNPKTTAVAVPADKEKALTELTRLVLVKCTLVANHQPGDPHMDKCRGQLWAHADERICSAVQKSAKRT